MFLSRCHTVNVVEKVDLRPIGTKGSLPKSLSSSLGALSVLSPAAAPETCRMTSRTTAESSASSAGLSFARTVTRVSTWETARSTSNRRQLRQLQPPTVALLAAVLSLSARGWPSACQPSRVPNAALPQRETAAACTWPAQSVAWSGAGYVRLSGLETAWPAIGSAED